MSGSPLRSSLRCLVAAVVFTYLSYTAAFTRTDTVTVTRRVPAW